MKHWYDSHDRFLVYTLVLASIIISLLVSGSNFSLQISRWSPAEVIAGISMDSYPPVLVADENKTVHAFSSQWMGNADPVKAVMYTQWSLDQGWSVPVDVLLSPIGEARVTSAYLDKQGTMHVVFFGGNNIAGDIYYSSAPADEAGDARSWSPPLLIGENAGDPESAVLVGNDQEFSVVYSGRSDGNGVYVVTTQDGGDTWSDPTPIFLADSDVPVVYGIYVIESKSGWLHAIWNVLTEAGQGRGIYYAKSKVGSGQWSDPILLASAPDGLGTQTPTIIEHDDVLFAVFNMTPKITMRRSVDNGDTWDDPVVPFSRHTGVNGSPSLVIDSSDNLHLLFGQRITGNPDIHGMWHSLWLGDRWSEPDAVVKGPRVVDKDGYSGFDPYEAHAVISQGNVLLVTWRTDPGDIRDNGVWSSYAILNTPELPIATLPSSSAIQIKATPLPLPTATLENEVNHQMILDKERHDPNPYIWVGLAIVFVGILRLIYVLVSRVK